MLATCLEGAYVLMENNNDLYKESSWVKIFIVFELDFGHFKQNICLPFFTSLRLHTKRFYIYK